MPTTLQPVVNIIAGQSTSFVPPGYSDVGNRVVACVIYNNLSSILTITGGTGQSLLMPFSADLFSCDGIVNAPSGTPNTSAANGTLLGTAQAVFYYEGDQLPVNYPQQLTAFPGGSQEIWASNGASLSAGFFGASPGLFFINTLTPFVFAPPPGTSSILFIPSAPGLEIIASPFAGTWTNVNLSLVGVQTGLVYGLQQIAGAGSGLQFAAGPFAFNIANAADTTFQMQVTGLLGSATSLLVETVPVTGNATLFARSAPAPPTDATAAVSGAFNSLPQTLLAAPTVGANYLFAWDIGIASTSAVQVTLQDGAHPGAGNYVASIVIPISTSAVAYQQMPEILLNGYRCTGALTLQAAAGTITGPGSIFTALRYAPGP